MESVVLLDKMGWEFLQDAPPLGWSCVVFDSH